MGRIVIHVVDDLETRTTCYEDEELSRLADVPGVPLAMDWIPVLWLVEGFQDVHRFGSQLPEDEVDRLPVRILMRSLFFYDINYVGVERAREKLLAWNQEGNRNGR